MKIKEWFDGEGEEKKRKKKSVHTNAYLKEEAQGRRQRNLRANGEKRKQHVEGRKGG